VQLIYHHPGGRVYVGQFGETKDAAILGADAVPLRPTFDFKTQHRDAGFLPTPAVDTWNTLTHVAIARQADGSFSVQGDDSAWGYQIVSPPIDMRPHIKTTFLVPYRTQQGRVCPGVLSRDSSTWVVAPVEPTTTVTFDSGLLRTVQLVLANCMPAEGHGRSQFVIDQPLVSQTEEPLYVDTLMDAARERR